MRMANMRGPPPLRSKGHLWGFPWIRGRYAKDLELGNTLVKFSIQVWIAVRARPVSWQGFPIFLLGEHPEDLGLVVREEDGLRICPASIWQISEIRNLVDAIGSVVGTVAINQCCWGAPWRKPTRLLASSPHVLQWGPNEWPSFDDEMHYTGPLSQHCQCQVSQSLVRRPNDEAFRTTGTDVYPPRLDEAIADAIVSRFTPCFNTSPLAGGERKKCWLKNLHWQLQWKKGEEKNLSLGWKSVQRMEKGKEKMKRGKLIPVRRCQDTVVPSGATTKVPTGQFTMSLGPNWMFHLLTCTMGFAPIKRTCIA